MNLVGIEVAEEIANERAEHSPFGCTNDVLNRILFFCRQLQLHEEQFLKPAVVLCKSPETSTSSETSQHDHT